MRILLTGSSGFIGSRLMSTLLAGRNSVFPYDRKLGFDLVNWRSMETITDIADFDMAIHLGAITTVGEAQENALNTAKVNVMGTMNILECCKELEMPTIIASTDKVYGYQQRQLPYDENTPLRPIGIYASTKASADLMAQSYIKNYGCPIVIMRPCNIFGYDYNASRLIPEVITKIMSKKEIVIRSDGKQVREYMYLGDMISAYLHVIENFEHLNGHAFNVGSGEHYSVLQVVDMIKDIMHSKDTPVKILDQAKNEIESQFLDSSKFMATGWKPKYDFKQGLIETIQEYVK